MKNKIKRMNNWINRVIINWKSDCQFSNKFASFRLKEEFYRKVRLFSLAEKASHNKDVYIINYLRKEFSSVIAQYQNLKNQGIRRSDSPIWICWWDGEDKAPGLVNQCIKSIRKFSGNHTVQLVDSTNFYHYIDVPENILDKYICGKMKTAQFCDYIRVSLLEKYGGLWLDSTIFCTRTIPETIYNLPFYTCKGPVQRSGYISDYRWTTFCLGGYKENLFFQIVRKMFEIYWENNETAIDYLLFDYIIEVVYQEIPYIKSLIDTVPESNLERDDLQKAMNENKPFGTLKEFLTADTFLYKLSWRESYSEVNDQGKATIYSEFLDLKI